MVEHVSAHPSKRTSLVLDAIGSALDSLSRLADSAGARELRERCLRCQARVQEWTRTAPTAQEREALMQHAVALNVAVTKLRTSSAPPKPDW
jgi:hypothetical protein